MKRFGLVTVVLFGLTACAGGGLTTREKGALIGGGLGAGAGAIIGSATGRGHAGTGALIGGGLGALSGAIIGDSLQAQEQRQAAAARSGAETPAPQLHAALRTGELVNDTRWRIQVFTDPDSASLDLSPSLVLEPGEVRTASMTPGSHRVLARAFTQVASGAGIVGRYDRTVVIENAGAGFRLRFTEADFR